MRGALSPDEQYPLLDKIMYILYVLDNADMVKDVLTRTNSICGKCPYKTNNEPPCKKRELCVAAIYSYLFHGTRREKMSRSGKKKVLRWINEVNDFFENHLGMRIIEENSQRVSLFQLSYPAFFVLFRLYHSFGEKISTPWFVDFDTTFDVVPLLAWFITLSEENEIIKEITSITIESGDLTLHLTLNTREETNLEIILNDHFSSNFRYSIRWYIGEFNILRWDNYHDEGYATAPHHVHVHDKVPILPWNYHSNIRELIRCVIALIRRIDEREIKLEDKDSLKNEIQRFEGC